MKNLLFLLILLQASFIVTNEYLYPIVSLDDETILMMHQKSINDLELLSLNTKSNKTQKLLSSLYLPAHIKILPNKEKYSFIDRGRIYIKDFSKRTPRALDIYEPIYDIQSLQWLNNNECIFSAKYKNHYKIFMYNILENGGTLYKFCDLDDGVNYIFPSVAEGHIFCLVQQDVAELYSIGHLKSTPVLFETHFDNSKDFVTILPLEYHKNPLCFLNMQTQNEGYVLEIVHHNHENQIFTFGCCKLDIQDGTIIKMFEFEIPEEFIIGMEKERFFESLYPLLPYYSEDKIYFTDYDFSLKQLVIYEYDLALKTIEKFQSIKKNYSDKHMFSPLILEDKFYVGHNIEK